MDKSDQNWLKRKLSLDFLIQTPNAHCAPLTFTAHPWGPWVGLAQILHWHDSDDRIVWCNNVIALLMYRGSKGS